MSRSGIFLLLVPEISIQTSIRVVGSGVWGVRGKTGFRTAFREGLRGCHQGPVSLHLSILCLRGWPRFQVGLLHVFVQWLPYLHPTSRWWTRGTEAPSKRVTGSLWPWLDVTPMPNHWDGMQYSDWPIPSSIFFQRQELRRAQFTKERQLFQNSVYYWVLKEWQMLTIRRKILCFLPYKIIILKFCVSCDVQ